ncbi:MAG: RloB family protein [Lactobacillaceae bacterium]|jgi:hypothetical protein|nr:RloB family protein [Lactobacillaceae bacterium]
MVRKRKYKKEKSKIYIFVEGETEQKYFDFLRQKLRLANVKIKTVVLDNSGQNWVEKTKRLVQNDIHYRLDHSTQVYVVFDKDELSLKQVEQMRVAAYENDFELGFSNIAFEVWLLAHFEELTTRGIAKAKLNRKLDRYLGQKYIKANSEQLEIMVSRYDVAIINAQASIDVDFKTPGTNIGTIINKIKSA